LERDLAKPLPRTGAEAGAGVATSQPPLYYALETIPYGLASSGTLLDQVALMRLLSALMGGLTALFAYLFLREALPEARWAWTVGGLGVALAPLLGQMSGAINPDALLFAVSAALFYCLARGFRRGITPRLATATGVVLAVGVSTKLNFLGLVPGAILGLLALCVSEARRSRSSAYRCFVLALGIGMSPIVLYGIVNLFSGRPLAGSVSPLIAFSRKGGSLPHELSYIWQFYLPRLPGMSHDFNGILTTRSFWFNGLVGLYGWLDTTFPRWVYNAALIPAGLLAVLLARALFVYRGALTSRVLELAVYLAIALGILFLIGADDYLHKVPGEYDEPRYLLPMLALWGAALALAARGAGRRWGPVAGVAIVSLVLAQDIFGQLLVISRYYG
jgi:4-amino-4-deoxy-L-arabinose transferase-like glycosyltransferase